jgi:hypothetical protein
VVDVIARGGVGRVDLAGGGVESVGHLKAIY